MNRSEFEHTVRAAGAVLGETALIVIGSQAIHASLAADLPEASMRSVETDIVPVEDPDGAKADLVDGSIGEASMFQRTFGYYAQGVTIDAAILPAGWRDRLVRFETPATHGVVAWCLDKTDLWISKALAGRPKDLEFCRALIAAGIVDSRELDRRLETVETEPERREQAVSLLDLD